MTYRDFPFQTAHANDERLPVLQGKTAIVTGAGTGIGRGVALLFANEGASVIIADQDSTRGEETLAAIEAAHGRACFVPGDVTDPKFHLGLVTFAKHRYGWLDIAVNNAGTSAQPTPLASTSLAAWDQITSVNLTAIFYAVRAQIPAMIEAGGGAIVNLASAGCAGAASAIGATSALTRGLIGLTKSIAAEYAPQGIRANAVIPGNIGTHPGSLEKIAEVAQSVLFLASPKSSFITGSCVPANGGNLDQ